MGLRHPVPHTRDVIHSYALQCVLQCLVVAVGVAVCRCCSVCCSVPHTRDVIHSYALHETSFGQCVLQCLIVAVCVAVSRCCSGCCSVSLLQCVLQCTTHHSSVIPHIHDVIFSYASHMTSLRYQSLRKCTSRIVCVCDTTHSDV